MTDRPTLTAHSGPQFTLMATVKDEAPFLLEWLAYHKVIGFQRFVIFSNDSTDGTTEILDALHRAGEITHIHHSPSPHRSIVRTVADMVLTGGHLRPGDWVLWLDADEFLNVHIGEHQVQDLAEVIDRAKVAQGMCIPWRLFGSAGNETFAGRFISPDFTQCQHRVVDWTNDKTLFRFDPQVADLYNHKPMMQAEFWQAGGTFLTPNGQGLDQSDPYVTNWRSGKPTGRISDALAHWDMAQINHYAVRTRKLTGHKRKRGRIAKPQALQRNRYGSIYFKRYNLNEVEDRSILRLERATLDQHLALAEIVLQQVPYFEMIRAHYRPRVVDLSGVQGWLHARAA